MKNRFRLVLIFSILLLLFSVFLSLFVGSTSISLSRVLEKGSTDNIIFLSIRVPRTAAAFFAGIAFALSGLLIQKATDNSLASPNMIGINSGAGVAVLVCLSFFPSLSYLLPIAAFLGALVAVASVMLISASSGRIRSSLSIILSGVAMNALFNAAISCISALDPDALATYSNFSIGGFAGVESSSLIFPVLLICISVLLSPFLIEPMRLICIGDEMASSHGYRVRHIRMLLLAFASLLAASAVTFSGLLGFVGLVTPHVASFLSGGEIRRSYALTLILGPVLTLVSDVLARTVVRPAELPCGIFMAIIGVPFFIFLLLRRKV